MSSDLTSSSSTGRPFPSSSRIQAIRVADHDRRNVLGMHFGRLVLVAERTIHVTLGAISQEYCSKHRCAPWHYYNLSNQSNFSRQSFYMAPAVESLLLWRGHGRFMGRMSGDAAGLTVCLQVYFRLASNLDAAMFGDLYRNLLDFARQHPEYPTIKAALY